MRDDLRYSRLHQRARSGIVSILPQVRQRRVATDHRGCIRHSQQLCCSNCSVLWPKYAIGVLWMSEPVIVRIVGAPIACAEGVRDSWRELAMWLADKLQARYGEIVQVQYFDLFDPGCPPLPPDAQLPLVMIDDAFISRGGKISQPAIRAHLEAIGLRPRGH